MTKTAKATTTTKAKPKTNQTEDRRAFVRLALAKFLNELQSKVHLVEDAIGIGRMAAALREFASEIDGFDGDNFDHGYELRFVGYEQLEAALGIAGLANDTRAQRMEEIRAKAEPKEFDTSMAAMGFDTEFTAWLRGVVDSDWVATPLQAGLLCRAIQTHVTSFIEITIGMSSSDAENYFREVVSGRIDEDAGHPIYSVLGIEDPDR